MVAGSELVILEIAEALIAAGWSCDIAAWSIGSPMRAIAEKAGVRLLDQPAEVRAFEYDLVWINNRLEAVFDYSLSPVDAPRTLFVFAHLDRTWSFAQPGVIVERTLASCFLVTEPLGIERLAEYGLPERDIGLFLNPAPIGFEIPPAPTTGGLRRLVIVSNHAPDEVLAAAALIRAQGVEVVHWGSRGDIRETRLSPADLAKADAVLTIGKTVPYALRAQRPAFVYDHFGGPGWLGPVNFQAAAERNFSGLCCERRLDAATLCEEILSGFGKAREFVQHLDETSLAPYRLESEIAKLLALQERAPTPAEHRARLDAHAPAWRSEQQLALALGKYFRSVIQAHRKKMRENESKIG